VATESHYPGDEFKFKNKTHSRGLFFGCHCHFASGMAMAIKFCHRVAIDGKWQSKNRKMANMAKMVKMAMATEE
jgi:hypothetical protein